MLLTLVPDLFSHLDSIPLSFPPPAQLEDEALKHIQNHCHELVSLNLQSCSVSVDPGIGPRPTCARPTCPSHLCAAHCTSHLCAAHLHIAPVRGPPAHRTCARPTAHRTCPWPHCQAAHARSGWHPATLPCPDSSSSILIGAVTLCKGREQQ